MEKSSLTAFKQSVAPVFLLPIVFFYLAIPGYDKTANNKTLPTVLAVSNFSPPPSPTLSPPPSTVPVIPTKSPGSTPLPISSGKTSSPIPTVAATSAPAVLPIQKPSVNGCQAPYSAQSPWNTKIVNPVYHPKNNDYMSRINGVFGADSAQYTYPVYYVDNSTPQVKVIYSGTYSEVGEGEKLTRDSGGGETFVRMPSHAEQSSGNDAQLIIIDKDTGEEWGLYHAAKNADGTWRAQNGYKYHVSFDGVPPSGFGSRGAGVTYLAGLIRKCEIESGQINHAIAFAYDYPAPSFVYPATKSDGRGTAADVPEGARFQLNPNANEAEIKTWCSGDSRINERSCRTLVRALQEYGMILIDGSDHPKIYAEDSKTANWGSLWSSKIPAKIPFSAFKVIDF